MSAPEPPSPEDHGEIVATPPGQLAQSLPAFLGFTVPAAKLHSIPLAPEFSELVESAQSENHVETPLPKFFNPLFRKQGVVNKHTINALASVGNSLKNLAREIEERDRALEKLTSHFNSYTDYAHRGQVTVVQFVEQLAGQIQEITSRIQQKLEQEAEYSRIRAEQIVRQIAEVAGNLQSRVEQEAERGQVRSSSVIATIRGSERRASELEKRQSELDREIEAVRDRLATLTGEFTKTCAGVTDQSRATRTLADETRAQLTSLHAAIAETKSTFNSASNRSADRIAHQEELLSAAQLAVDRRFADLDSKCTANHDEARKQVTTQGERLCEIERRMDLLATGVSDELRMITERLAQAEGRVTAQFAVSTQSAESTNQKIAALEDLVRRASAVTESRLKAIDDRHELIVTNARALQGEQRTLATELERLHTGLLDLTIAHQAIAKQSEEAGIMLRGVKTAMDAFLSSTPSSLQNVNEGEPSIEATYANAAPQAATIAAQNAISDAFYVAFEARFRGPQKLIRERQSVYLPVIIEARERINLYPPVRTTPETAPQTPPLPTDGVIDLGCGRGEWLGLLAESGVPALGVEKNQFFVDICRQKNCAVVHGDIMAFLRSAPSDSVAAITSFHVIEHLPIPCFDEMTRHVFRILRRGGVVIFETPNPSNIITSSFNFLSDPTHLRPVHPDFGKLLLETTGFAPVNLRFLSPVDSSTHVGAANDPLAQRFNQLFYGPQDFAIIGIKP